MLKVCVPPADAIVEYVYVNVPTIGRAPDALQTVSIPLAGATGALTRANAAAGTIAATSAANRILRPTDDVTDPRMGAPYRARRTAIVLAVVHGNSCRDASRNQYDPAGLLGIAVPREVPEPDPDNGRGSR